MNIMMSIGKAKQMIEHCKKTLPNVYKECAAYATQKTDDPEEYASFFLSRLHENSVAWFICLRLLPVPDDFEPADSL